MNVVALSGTFASSGGYGATISGSLYIPPTSCFAETLIAGFNPTGGDGSAAAQFYFTGVDYIDGSGVPRNQPFSGVPVVASGDKLTAFYYSMYVAHCQVSDILNIYF